MMVLRLRVKSAQCAHVEDELVADDRHACFVVWRQSLIGKMMGYKFQHTPNGSLPLGMMRLEMALAPVAACWSWPMLFRRSPDSALAEQKRSTHNPEVPQVGSVAGPMRQSYRLVSQLSRPMHE